MRLEQVESSKGNMSALEEKVDVLMRYFGNTVSPEKGKPTNGEFIALIADKLTLESQNIN